MRKNTAALAELERDWVAEVAQVWNERAREGKPPTGTALAEALAARWHMSRTLGERTAGGCSNPGQRRAE